MMRGIVANGAIRRAGRLRSHLVQHAALLQNRHRSRGKCKLCDTEIVSLQRIDDASAHPILPGRCRATGASNVGRSHKMQKESRATQRDAGRSMCVWSARGARFWPLVQRCRQSRFDCGVVIFPVRLRAPPTAVPGESLVAHLVCSFNSIRDGLTRSMRLGPQPLTRLQCGGVPP